MVSDFNYSVEESIRHKRNLVPDESIPLHHLISRELLKLSPTERSAINEEIHGVSCLAADETPEMIQDALLAFQTELDGISREKKKVYEECLARRMLQQNDRVSCYVLDDEDFRLRFLRAELFNVKEAVIRFIKYLDFVREQWGMDIAVRRLIVMSDFSREEMKVYRKGFFQTLRFRDRSGRRVLSFLGGLTPDIDPKVRSKILFYLADALTRNDVESQKRGFIVTTEAYCWSVEESGNEKRSKQVLCFPNPRESLHLWKCLIESIPSRLIAVHNCWPERPAFQLIAKLITLYGMGNSATKRLRLQFHMGNELEMRYRLKTFGIPIELLPITETGIIKRAYHINWMKTVQMIEQGLDTDAKIVNCPGMNDVVFRRGTSSMENPGNAKFRDTALALFDREDVDGWSLRNPRIRAVDRLLDILRQKHHGRLLEWDNRRACWVEMTDISKMKRKVSVLLRTILRQHSSGPRNRYETDELMNYQERLIGPEREDYSHTHSVQIDVRSALQRALGPYDFLERDKRRFQGRKCCEESEANGTCIQKSRHKRSRHNL